jgi:autonomous glycyl radical cofactor GrcA
MTVLVEVLTSAACGRCIQAKAQVKTVVAEFNYGDIRYREVNVVEEIDYAVKLGALNIPAIAIDGVLVFSALPSAERLYEAIRTKLSKIK